jgi:hypothetical protein
MALFMLKYSFEKGSAFAINYIVVRRAADEVNDDEKFTDEGVRYSYGNFQFCRLQRLRTRRFIFTLEPFIRWRSGFRD